MSKKIFLITLLAIACLGQFSTDIYVALLGDIAESLNADIKLLQKSMAIFMLGLASSQLVYGALSESWGRRKPLILGLTIMLIGSLCCWYSLSVYWLLLGRFTQGCGVGSCAALWRAIFRDKFKGNELAQYGSYFSIAIIFVIPAAPVLGSYLAHQFGWQSVFAFMVGYTLVCLYLILYHFQETAPESPKLLNRDLIKQYQNVLKEKQFLTNTVGTCICYGGFFSWFVSGAVIFTEQFNLSPTNYGWLSLVSSTLAMGLGGFLNGRLVTKWGTHHMLRLGLVLMAISNLLFWLIQQADYLGTLSLAIIMFIYLFGLTFIWPNAFANAFDKVGHSAGCAGALYGFMQILGGALAGSLFSWLPTYSTYPLAGINLAVILLGSLCFTQAARYK